MNQREICWFAKEELSLVHFSFEFDLSLVFFKSNSLSYLARRSFY